MNVTSSQLLYILCGQIRNTAAIVSIIHHQQVKVRAIAIGACDVHE